jgi:hypothetical protein
MLDHPLLEGAGKQVYYIFAGSTPVFPICFFHAPFF